MINKEGNEEFKLKQENMYMMKSLCYFRWYRKLYGGKWTLLKMGKDTPNIRLFSTWTKVPHKFTGVKELYSEEYPITNVDTRIKLFKQFFKNIFK